MENAKRDLYIRLPETNENFKQHEHIQSILMYGDPNKIKDPLISFVIPTYKRPDLLKEALASVLHQEYMPNEDTDATPKEKEIREHVRYEVIVIDNSTDESNENETFQLIKDLAPDNLLYYVNEENLGQAGNWNRGFVLARGKYVSLLHDDDLLAYNYLTQILKCLGTIETVKGELGVIRTRFLEFSNTMDLPPLRNKYKGGVRQFTLVNALAIEGIGPTGCPTCGMLFNRQAVLNVGGFNASCYPSHDYVLGYLLLKAGYTAFTTEDVLGYYRIGQNETMKPGVLEDFCKCDYYFRELMYSDNLITKLYGTIFRNVQYSLNLEGLKARAEKFHLAVSIRDLAFEKGYGLYPIRRRLYIKLRDNLVKKHEVVLRKPKKIEEATNAQ